MIDLLKQYVDGGAILTPHQFDKLPRNLFITYIRKIMQSTMHYFQSEELSIIGKKSDWLTDDMLSYLWINYVERFFSFIENPSERVQLFMVQKRPLAIEKILKNGIIPSEEAQLYVVKHNGLNIKLLTDYGINPSEDVQMAAIFWDHSYINFIPNPHPNVLNFVNKYKKND